MLKNIRVVLDPPRTHGGVEMSRIYAVREDNGERFLHRIKCDSCGDEITPNPHISSSGWVIHGRKSPHSDEVMEWVYCSSCDTKITYELNR